MFETRRQLLRRIERLEKRVEKEIAISTPTWDYACSICENGIHCIDGAGKHVIACSKKMPQKCKDFILDKSYSRCELSVHKTEQKQELR